MDQLLSILRPTCFGSSKKGYRRVRSSDSDSLQNETNTVIEMTQLNRYDFHHVTTRVDRRYLFLWLDEHSTKPSLDTEHTINVFSKFSYLRWKFYTESDQFLNDIQSENYQDNQLLLIVSGSLAEQVLPKIRNKIPSVIVFCTNHNKYIKLKSNYSNVVDVCTDHETLNSLIQRELSSLKLSLNETTPLKSMKSLVSTTIANLNSDDTSSSSIAIGNETCFSYILIIDLLKRMPQTNEAKHLWFKKCREYYRGNEKMLQGIDEFSETYLASDAIKWYQKRLFVHQPVNVALCTDDIFIWYVFRYYIVDLCKQIEMVHQRQNYPANLKVYRGQSMLMKELESIKELITNNNLFCTTAFFSTSRNISIAKLFMSDSNSYNGDQRVPVLFEITVDSVNLQSVTFIDMNQYLIKEHCTSSEEEEFLFTIGSVFRITDVKQDSEDTKIWKIYMKASDDGAPVIQRQLDLMKNKYSNVKDMNLLFGLYLMDMNQLAKAKSYFQLLLHELKSSNDKQNYHGDLILVNTFLGELHTRETNYQQAYQYFQAADEIQSKQKTSIYLVTSDISFGNYYKNIGHFSQARKYYTDALRKLDQNHLNINRLNIHIASIHAIDGDYDNSLQLCLQTENALKKVQLIYPVYSEMIICQGLIGDIYFFKQDYQRAEKFYLNVLNMCKQYLYIGHRQLIHCICSLTELYRKKLNDNDEKACAFCEEHLEQHRQHLSYNHLSIAHLLMKLGHIKQDMNYYLQAFDILMNNDYLEYLTIAECYKFIGHHYLKNEINHNVEKAVENFSKAKEIYKKIYPENHSLTIEIELAISFIKK